MQARALHLAVLLCAVATVLGGRPVNVAVRVGAPGELPSAAAPGPNPVQPYADTLFIVAAPSAALTGDELVMTGVHGMQHFVTADMGTGAVTTEAFANSSTGSPLLSPSGQWLGSPVAVLRATQGGNATAALLLLSEPRYDHVKRALTFHTKILPVDGTAALPTIGGAAGRLVAEKAAGVGPVVLTQPPDATAPLTGVALFIDLSSQNMGAHGRTEDW
ncbi:hypothetical protein WJX81_003443 [Elliptochloris bilobata]|uniref:CHRD domain-containing protein n=1 Tax=Elliptochloris bilobata TaxID=381761 RepID=A0AAW1QKS1_9CHLO